MVVLYMEIIGFHMGMVSDMPGPAWPERPGFGLAWHGSSSAKGMSQAKAPTGGLAQAWLGSGRGFRQQRTNGI